MNSHPFLFALVLLLLGQVPLVVRLWLDHKERVAPFRKQLYERQVEVFQEVYRGLTDSFESLHNILCIARPGVAVDPEHRELVANTKGAAGPAHKRLSDALRQAELFLPAPLIVAISDYNIAWARLLEIIVGNRALPDAELRKEWETLNGRYNTIVNTMRMCLGVDALSGQLLALVIRKDAPMVMTKRTL